MCAYMCVCVCVEGNMTLRFMHTTVLHISERPRVLRTVPGLGPRGLLRALSSPAFICCWSPYFLFDMLDNFSLLPDTEQRFYASVIIQNLPALNSAINPLVYLTFSSSVCFPRR